MEQTIRIGLVEDQQLFREGIKSILSAYPDFEVVFESADGHSVVEKLTQAPELPDVLLVDLSLPAHEGKEFTGVDVTDAVLAHFPEVRIIVLSVHDDQNFIAELIEHGAHGYLVKDSDPNEVRDAIKAVVDKGLYINERTLRAIQQNMANKHKKTPKFNIQGSELTKREIEILQLVCKQLTTEEIAERLFISPKTVNGHRNNLLQKTNSRNTAGLVLYAMKHKVIEAL